jgi:hypothetical protein
MLQETQHSNRKRSLVTKKASNQIDSRPFSFDVEAALIKIREDMNYRLFKIYQLKMSR